MLPNGISAPGRIAAFAGFDKLLGLPQRRHINQNDVLLCWSRIEEVRGHSVGFYHCGCVSGVERLSPALVRQLSSTRTGLRKKSRKFVGFDLCSIGSRVVRTLALRLVVGSIPGPHSSKG